MAKDKLFTEDGTEEGAYGRAMLSPQPVISDCVPPPPQIAATVRPVLMPTVTAIVGRLAEIDKERRMLRRLLKLAMEEQG